MANLVVPLCFLFAITAAIVLYLEFVQDGSVSMINQHVKPRALQKERQRRLIVARHQNADFIDDGDNGNGNGGGGGGGADNGEPGADVEPTTALVQRVFRTPPYCTPTRQGISLRNSFIFGLVIGDENMNVFVEGDWIRGWGLFTDRVICASGNISGYTLPPTQSTCLQYVRPEFTQCLPKPYFPPIIQRDTDEYFRSQCSLYDEDIRRGFGDVFSNIHFPQCVTIEGPNRQLYIPCDLGNGQTGISIGSVCQDDTLCQIYVYPHDPCGAYCYAASPGLLYLTARGNVVCGTINVRIHGRTRNGTCTTRDAQLDPNAPTYVIMRDIAQVTTLTTTMPVEVTNQQQASNIAPIRSQLMSNIITGNNYYIYSVPVGLACGTTPISECYLRVQPMGIDIGIQLIRLRNAAICTVPLELYYRHIGQAFCDITRRTDPFMPNPIVLAPGQELQLRDSIQRVSGWRQIIYHVILPVRAIATSNQAVATTIPSTINAQGQHILPLASLCSNTPEPCVVNIMPQC